MYALFGFLVFVTCFVAARYLSLVGALIVFSLIVILIAFYENKPPPR